MQNKPLVTPIIETSLGHPFEKGLQAYYHFNETGNKVFDLTRRGNDLDVVGASRSESGLKCINNNAYASLDNTSQVVNVEACTIVIKFKSLSAFADGSTRVLLGQLNRPVYQSGNIGFFKSSTNAYFGILLYDTAQHYIRVAPADLPNWQIGTQIAVQFDRNNVINDGKKIACNVDGKYVTPLASLNATSWNSVSISNTIHVGNDSPDTTRESNGIIKLLAVYNRVLSENELKLFYKYTFDRFN